MQPLPSPELVVPPQRQEPIDPGTGHLILTHRRGSPVHEAEVAADRHQIGQVDALKRSSIDFGAMRRFAMRIRGIMRSRSLEKLTEWIAEIQYCGIHAMQRFARTLNEDLDAVRNAVTEPWSNGQAEGQINRLKTIKRAMFGRAGIELLRARMLPFADAGPHIC